MLKKIVKKVYEQRRKADALDFELCITKQDNEKEAQALVELLGGHPLKGEEVASEERFTSITTYINLKKYLTALYDDFVKNECTEEPEVIKENMDLFLFYAILEFNEPLNDIVKEFNRFAWLYSITHVPNDGDKTFHIPYSVFQLAKVMVTTLQECIGLELMFRNAEKKENKAAKH